LKTHFEQIPLEVVRKIVQAGKRKKKKKKEKEKRKETAPNDQEEKR
jgi:hypothetical protein